MFLYQIVLKSVFAACAHRPPPQLAVRGKSCYQTVQLISLRIRKAAIIRDAFQICLEPSARLKRRPFDGTGKVDVEFDLQSSNGFFDTRDLLVDRSCGLQTRRRKSLVLDLNAFHEGRMRVRTFDSETNSVENKCPIVRQFQKDHKKLSDYESYP